MAVGKTRVLLEPKLVAAMGVETVERCLQRKMPDTVLSWSAEKTTVLKKFRQFAACLAAHLS